MQVRKYMVRLFWDGATAVFVSARRDGFTVSVHKAERFTLQEASDYIEEHGGTAMFEDRVVMNAQLVYRGDLE